MLNPQRWAIGPTPAALAGCSAQPRGRRREPLAFPRPPVGLRTGPNSGPRLRFTLAGERWPLTTPAAGGFWLPSSNRVRCCARVAGQRVRRHGVRALWSGQQIFWPAQIAY